MIPTSEVQSESTYKSGLGLGSTLARGADGTIVTVNQQSAAQVWVPGERQPRQLTGTPSRLATRFVTLSRDGRTVATIDGPLGIGDHTVHLWDAETGRRINASVRTDPVGVRRGLQPERTCAWRSATPIIT